MSPDPVSKLSPFAFRAFRTVRDRVACGICRVRCGAVAGANSVSDQCVVRSAVRVAAPFCTKTKSSCVGVLGQKKCTVNNCSSRRPDTSTCLPPIIAGVTIIRMAPMLLAVVTSPTMAALMPSPCPFTLPLPLPLPLPLALRALALMEAPAFALTASAAAPLACAIVVAPTIRAAAPIGTPAPVRASPPVWAAAVAV
jgi:hypothetical protein